MLVSAHPIALNVILLWLKPSWAVTKIGAWGWLAVFSLIDALMLVAANSTWTFVGERADLVDDMLKAAKGAEQVSTWLDRRLSARQQLPLPLIGLIFGPIFLKIISHQMTSIVEIGFPSYVSVAFTSFVGGNVCYWLWVAPGLPKRMHKVGRLTTRWQDPASTPGIRMIAEGLGLSALFLLGGAMSISVAGFIVPGVTKLTLLNLLLDAFFVLVFATSARVGVYSFVWVYAIVAGAKRDALARLDIQVPHIHHLGTRSGADRGMPILALYGQVSSAPNMPFSMGALVQYGATLVGTALAFVASILVK